MAEDLAKHKLKRFSNLGKVPYKSLHIGSRSLEGFKRYSRIARGFDFLFWKSWFHVAAVMIHVHDPEVGLAIPNWMCSNFRRGQIEMAQPSDIFLYYQEHLDRITPTRMRLIYVSYFEFSDLLSSSSGFCIVVWSFVGAYFESFLNRTPYM